MEPIVETRPAPRPSQKEYVGALLRIAVKRFSKWLDIRM
jgi:hypothetical protein